MEYLKQGLSVIPLAKDKKPLLPWQEFQTRYATEDEVATWYQRYPNANIGIVTGKISNLTVIDCDSQPAIEYFQSGYHGRTTSVKTPKGMHFYFQYQEGVRNTARLTDHIDVRSEGGYVVAPPSVNDAGIAYRFVNDFSIGLDSFSSCFLFALYKGDVTRAENERYKALQELQILTKGTRDEDLFHTANCLVKGGCKPEFARQVLRILAQNATPPFPENELDAKIKSALDRSERRQRTLAHEIRQWVELQNGYFSVTDCYGELQIVTKEEKGNARIVFHRLCNDEKLIEKYGEKQGVYRPVKSDVQIIDWQNADEKEYPFEMPLSIHELAKLYPGNIAVLAGASNTGKTSFMLETIRLNQKYHKVTYLNSEMGAQELKIRLKLFEEVITLDKWKFRALERSSSFADVVDPTGFNIIDFLEVYDDFWKIGGWIRDIHEKLTSGICLIAIQKRASTKKQTNDYGRGGELTLEKPRLYLSMDRGRIKVVKAKIWRNHERNPNGLIRDFKIVNGWKFLPTSKWESEDDAKYGFLTED